MKSNFEIALERQEMPDFFRGKGPYLTRDGMWDEHLFCINWPGIFRFIESHANGAQVFIESFERYLNSLQETMEDCLGLRENLFNFYAERKRRTTDCQDLLAQLPEPSRRLMVQRLTWYRWELENQWRLYAERSQRMSDCDCPQEFLNLKSSPYA